MRSLQLLTSLALVSAAYLPGHWGLGKTIYTGENQLPAGFRFFASRDASMGEGELTKMDPIDDFGRCYPIPADASSMRIYGHGGHIRWFQTDECGEGAKVYGSYQEPGSVIRDLNTNSDQTFKSFSFRSICHRHKGENILVWCDARIAMSKQPSVEEGDDHTWTLLSNATDLNWVAIDAKGGIQT